MELDRSASARHFQELEIENREADRWTGNPLRLPRLRGDAIPATTGDRRPGIRFCAGCGSSLEDSGVLRGFWAYCSVECAIRTERGG